MFKEALDGIKQTLDKLSKSPDLEPKERLELRSYHIRTPRCNQPISNCVYVCMYVCLYVCICMCVRAYCA